MKKQDKICIFKVTLDLNSPKMDYGKVNREIRESGKTPWRKIATLGSQSLFDFAEGITDSFGFILDHCFGFYGNIGKGSIHNSKEKYVLFNDLEEVESVSEAKGVKEIKVSRVFSKKEKKMLFYFDYGDGWHFPVELKDIQESKVEKLYPVLLEKSGQNPEQYPPLPSSA